MPKVTRDRNERYRGGGPGPSSVPGQQPPDSFYGNQYSSTYSQSNTDMFSGPFAVSTPLNKGSQLPNFNPTMSPVPSTPTGSTSRLGIYTNNFKPDYFRVPTTTTTTSSGYLFPPPSNVPQISSFIVGNSKKSTKSDPAKDNITELNKKFLMSCVESLKRDNGSCLAPAICEYLLQTMSIINQIQTNTGLPHMKDLLHDIRKLLSRMNGKYFEVKAKQEMIKEDIRRKSGKTSSTPVKPKIETSPIVPTMAWTTGAATRKREREPTPQSVSPRIFSTFNGDSQSKDQASSTKRVREEDATPPNSPALPTCNGLLPLKDIKMFTQSIVPPPQASTNEEDENEEPPKNVFTPVVEADAVYSKRCKLYEKREGSFKERGIGVLYINKIKTDEDKNKFQVVIRADNSLGTVLLNIHLNSGLPIQKNGKNNVMTVDPAGDGGKGTSVLIRVKTGEDVDELIEKLNEFKGKS